MEKIWKFLYLSHVFNLSLTLTNSYRKQSIFRLNNNLQFIINNSYLQSIYSSVSFLESHFHMTKLYSIMKIESLITNFSSITSNYSQQNLQQQQRQIHLLQLRIEKNRQTDFIARLKTDTSQLLSYLTILYRYKNDYNAL